MDLVANKRHGNGTVFVEKTGNYSGNSRVDILDRVAAIGEKKAKGLVGFHNFTGADWSGKFVGITKDTWLKAYLDLSDDDDVISCFELLGTLSLTVDDQRSTKLPAVPATPAATSDFASQFELHIHFFMY